MRPVPFLASTLLLLTALALAPADSSTVLHVAQQKTKKKPTTQKKSPAPKPLTAKEIFAKYRGAMVQIKTKTRVFGEIQQTSGSGFFYIASDTIATAFHVIQGAESIEIVNVHGVKFVPTMLKIDTDSDVALIRVATKTKGPVLKGKAFAGIQVGETAFAIGNALGRFPDTITQGIVSGKRKSEGIPLVQTSTPISEGNSGGPLLDDQGRVIGIVDAYAEEGQNTNFAVAMNQTDTLFKDGEAFGVAEYLAYNKAAPTRIAVMPDATVRPKLLFDFQMDDPVVRVAMSPDGDAVALSTETEVAVVSVPEGKLIHRAKTASQVSAMLYASADRLFLFQNNRTVEVRNPVTWKLEGSYAVSFPVYYPQLLPTENLLLYGTSDLIGTGDDQVEKNWRIASLEMPAGTAREVMRDFAVGGFFAMGDQGRIFALERNETGSKATDRLVMLDTASGAKSILKEVKWDSGDDGDGSSLDFAAISPDRKTLAVAVNDVSELGGPSLELFDAVTGKSTKTLPKLMPYFVIDFNFADSGNRLLVSGLTDLYFVDLQREATEFKIARNGTSYGASKDCHVLALSHDNSVRVYSVIFGTEYKGDWVEEGDSKSTLSFGDNHAVTLTFDQIPGEKDVVMRIIGTWSDQGDHAEFKIKDVQVDGLLDSEQSDVIAIKKRLMQAGTLPIQVEWIDHDHFTISVMDSTSTYHRK